MSLQEYIPRDRFQQHMTFVGNVEHEAMQFGTFPIDFGPTGERIPWLLQLGTRHWPAARSTMDSQNVTILMPTFAAPYMQFQHAQGPVSKTQFRGFISRFRIPFVGVKNV